MMEVQLVMKKIDDVKTLITANEIFYKLYEKFKQDKDYDKLFFKFIPHFKKIKNFYCIALSPKRKMCAYTLLPTFDNYVLIGNIKYLEKTLGIKINEQKNFICVI